MSGDGPRIVAGGDKDGFRLVRVAQGDRVTYVMEIPDEPDALGCERWREAKINGKPAELLRDWVIRRVTQEQG